MCGIFAYLFNNEGKISMNQRSKIINSAVKSQHRGPDTTEFVTYDDRVCLCFHRLAIMDKSKSGNQPISLRDSPNQVLVCNGEIYNFKKLAEKYSFELESGSDCEIVLHMIKRFGIEETVKQLDGVFAFIYYDMDTNVIHVARDPFGVRALYMGLTGDGDAVFTSERKSIDELVATCDQFPPGNYMTVHSDSEERNYNPISYYDFHYPYTKIKSQTEYVMETTRIIYEERVRKLLEKAVDKRLMSERPIGCLLSGGLDSSLVTALVARHFPRGELKTFSIGLPGSEDLRYARLVADHLGTDHHEVVVSEKQMLKFIEKDIYQIETYDTTTIRASVPMLMLSHYIQAYTDIKVVYSGEGSDEASGSYLYFHNAPTPDAFHDECTRLLKDMHMYDVLRCDKSTAGAGLEVRVPFLDLDFIDYYMSIPPEFKMPHKGIEKYLLRKAFDGLDLLPKEVLWRMKEGFSDGCSSKSRSWYEIIQEWVETRITDEEFEAEAPTYYNPPKFKEALYYRRVFSKLFNERDNTVPYYWLPKWSGDISEPSARVLKVYE